MATKKNRNPAKPRKMIGIRKPSTGLPTRLVALRLLKGWTQQDAAERIGISSTYLSSLEAGEKLGLLEELLVRVADVYGTSLDYIYGRSSNAVERFAAATPEVQGSILYGILSGVARIMESQETLRYVDEIVTMAANELPGWPALQAFRDAPALERSSILSQLALTLGRLVRDREALKYVTAIVLRFAQGANPQQPSYTYSIEKDQQSLSHHLTSIERMFGRQSPSREEQLTPSRFSVSPEPAPTPKKKSKAKKKSVKKTTKKK